MAHAALSLLALVLSLLSLVGAIYITAFAWLGCWYRGRTPHRAVAGAESSFLVLVPAHNEGTGVVPTLRSLANARYPRNLLRVLTIADNCSDTTAECARSEGAAVWERVDPVHPGKGQALAWAMQKALGLRWDLIAVIDADSVVCPDFFARLDTAWRNLRRKNRDAVALQARYEFRPALGAETWFQDLSVASKAAENSFSYLPRTRLGLVNLIQGNGFALSRAALERAPFRAGSVVEDAEYAVEMALAGVPVVHVDDAVVSARMTSRVSDAAPQRLRWATGMFALIASSAPRLVRQAIVRRNWRLLEAAGMMLLTSRVTLALLTASAVVATLAAGRPPAGMVAGLLAASVALQSIYLWMVLRRSGGPVVGLGSLVRLPAYLGFVGLAQAGAAFGLKRNIWHRTQR
jgi:cellulose synthase/poly-beta-1,6-N-acetylglucosamine synthase-like glycosyltransferase